MRWSVIALVLAACAQPTEPGPIEQSGVEVFEVPGAAPTEIDLLIVLDDTAEMTPYLARVDAMLRAIDRWPQDFTRKPDLHIAIATADPADAGIVHMSSYVHGAFLVDEMRPDWSRETNYDNTLDEALSHLGDVGTGGAASAPLVTLRAALEQTPGFLREKAYLAVVIVSAHDDASSVDPQALAEWLMMRKPERVAVLVGAALPASAPRIRSFISYLPFRSTIASIDDPAYTQALSFLDADEIDFGTQCLPQPADVDPGPTIQFDCSVEIVQSDGVVREVPACPVDEPSYCWSFEPDPVNCAAIDVGHIAIGNFGWPLPSMIRGQCVVAK